MRDSGAGSGFIRKMGEWLVGHSHILMALVIITTLFFAWEARKVKLKNPTIDLFPYNHPYVETYRQYEDVFGGANVILIDLTVKQGDIYLPKTLEKIRRITKALELLPGVNNYQVLSLAQRKIKKTTVDEVEGFKSEPVMWPDIPKTEEELIKLRRIIHTTGNLRGSLVSRDNTSTLIVAGFFEPGQDDPGASLRKVIGKLAAAEGTDPAAKLQAFEQVVKDQSWNLDDNLFGAIQKICKAEEDENTTIHMIGRPILLGWVYKQFPQIYWIFGLTIAAILLVLFLYFRDVRGVAIPMTTALISAIWGIGFLGLLNYYFNPLVIVVPFVISARALSHSVQLIERFIEEYIITRDRKKAAVNTFTGLFRPGVLSLVIDAASVFMVIITPIPLMRKLALMGGYWVMSIVVSNVIFNPLILLYLPPPKLREQKKSFLDRTLETIGAWSRGRQRWPILIITGVVFIIGFVFARNLVIGDVHPGTPLLWPGSVYNKDTSKIGEKFGNTEIMSVVVEGANKNSIKHPQVLREMEALQRTLENSGEVSNTNSIADLLPEITKIMHGGNPRFELIPYDPNEAGFYLEMIFSGAEPGDLARFITNDFKDANISVYLSDHKGETLRKVVATAKKFIADHSLEGAKFRLAGNMGGLLAAVNEAIVFSEAKVTIAAFLLVFLFCAISYKSVIAGLLFLVPTAISNYLTYALMGALGIGLDVNALPVVSLGVGLGVDYGLYIVGRIQEEFAAGQELDKAVIIAIGTAGRAVLFTASTMVAGIIFWAFSFLRFQAEIGILLAFWMVISMIGGLLLLPILVLLIKPKFIMKLAPAKT